MEVDAKSNETLYQITSDERPGYLYFYVECHDFRSEVVKQYWREIGETCKLYSATKVMVEKASSPAQPVTDTYETASALSKLGFSRITIAFVEDFAGDTARFAENVANNRGVRLKVFDNAAEAEEWLLAPHQ